MRSFWKKANDKQLDLLGVDPVVPDVRRMDTPALVKTGSLRAYEPRRIARGDPSGNDNSATAHGA